MAAFAVVAGLWGAQPAGAADPPPLLTLPTGPNPVLVLADGSGKPAAGNPAFTVRVPVAVAADKDIEVRLIDVAYKEGHSAELFPRFKVVLSRSTPPAHALLVSYCDTNLWPGTYALTLRVSEKPRRPTDKPAAPIELVLNVAAPAPQLAGSTKVALSFTIASPWSGAGKADTSDPEAARVQLAERGGKIGAFDLEAVEFHDAPTDADTGTGTLTFDPPRASVPAGGASAVAVVASGVFPLGVTKGRIEWMSQSLATPLAVPFEVKVTLARWWILVIVAVGVASGFLLRKLLTDLQGRLSAREAVTLSLLLASRALEGRADAAYRKRLGDIIQALDEALAGDDAKKMVDLAKRKADEINALSDALEARFAPARDKLLDIGAVVDLELHLPEPVAGQAKLLRVQVGRANELLQQRDMTAVDELMKRLSGQEIPDLIRATTGVVGNLARFLQDTAQAPFPMSVAATRLLRDLANEATGQGQVLSTSIAPSPTDARSLLLRADALWLRCVGLADGAEALTRELCGNAVALLKALPASQVSEFDAVANSSIAAARRFAADMRALGDRQAFGGSPALAALWLAFLTAMAPTALPQAMQDLLAKAAWLEALGAAVDARVEANKKAGLPTRALQGGVTPDDTATKDALGLQAAPRVPLGPRIDDAPKVPMVQDLVERLQGLERRNWQAALLQSLGLGAVFVLVSYFIVGDAWIGTYKEIGTLFVLAFGLDLTSDGVLAALKKS